MSRLISLSIVPFDYDPFFQLVIDRRPFIRFLADMGGPLPISGRFTLREEDRTAPDTNSAKAKRINGWADEIMAMAESNDAAFRRELLIRLVIEAESFWRDPLEARREA